MCFARPKCNGAIRRTKEKFTAVVLGRELVHAFWHEHLSRMIRFNNIGGARTCGVSLLGAAFHNGCIYLLDLQIVLGVGQFQQYVSSALNPCVPGSIRTNVVEAGNSIVWPALRCTSPSS